MCKMISLAVVLAASLSATLISAATLESDGWSPKFYDGLEAVGDVVFNPVGYRKEKMAIGLKWTDGMAKFGAAKIFERMKGSAEWTVSAQVKCAPGGRAACAVQFFNKDKRTLGVFDCGSCSHDDWTLGRAEPDVVRRGPSAFHRQAAGRVCMRRGFRRSCATSGDTAARDARPPGRVEPPLERRVAENAELLGRTDSGHRSVPW